LGSARFYHSSVGKVRAARFGFPVRMFEDYTSLQTLCQICFRRPRALPRFRFRPVPHFFLTFSRRFRYAVPSGFGEQKTVRVEHLRKRFVVLS
jgi:hypothetical protein